ncbi:hypothetical protein DRQ53_01755 [bacterium]|nr:MAG: hypothetical protein DRQ53_01755 [bacterium]
MTIARIQPKPMQLIFAFFLGLMVTAFIGVGVYTFHPPQVQGLEDQARELRADQQVIRDAAGIDGLDQAQQDQLASLGDQLIELSDKQRVRQENWARTTSIILIVLATLVMMISLLRADQLPVLSNGLLLGGLFTMLYGTGWIIASGDSMARFWVLAFALVVTLGLGYVRFVRARPAAAIHEGGTVEHGELGERVEKLEQTLQAVAVALRSGGVGA